MPAYAAMLLYINYAQIYASIIRQGLHVYSKVSDGSHATTLPDWVIFGDKMSAPKSVRSYYSVYSILNSSFLPTNK